MELPILIFIFMMYKIYNYVLLNLDRWYDRWSCNVMIPDEIALKILNHINNIHFADIYMYYRIKHKYLYTSLISRFKRQKINYNFKIKKEYEKNYSELDSCVTLLFECSLFFYIFYYVITLPFVLCNPLHL